MSLHCFSVLRVTFISCKESFYLSPAETPFRCYAKFTESYALLRLCSSMELNAQHNNPCVPRRIHVHTSKSPGILSLECLISTHISLNYAPIKFISGLNCYNSTWPSSLLFKTDSSKARFQTTRTHRTRWYAAWIQPYYPSSEPSRRNFI